MYGASTTASLTVTTVVKLTELNVYHLLSMVCSSQDELGVHKDVQYTQKSHFICTKWVDTGRLWTPQHLLGQTVLPSMHHIHRQCTDMNSST